MAKRPYWGKGVEYAFCPAQQEMVAKPCKCNACASKRAPAANIVIRSDSFYDGKYISAVNQRVTSKRQLKEIAARKDIRLEFY